MDIKEIQELIKFVSKSGVNEVEIESKGFKLVIRTGHSNAAPTYIQAAPVAAPIAAPQVIAAPAATSAETKAAEKKAEAAANDAKLITIKSPMIGTFYRSAGPDKPQFVAVGDEISSGKVVCIIEAMKLFNEIESEISGKIVKVLVDDATPVEYDQPLFLVEPA